MDPTDFHRMDKMAFFKIESYTGVKWHEGEQINIFIFG